jgi:Flp pilus assembly pilin Flp
MNHHTMDHSDIDIDISAGEPGLLRCERGQALTEYALILAFVSIVGVGLTPMGQWVALRLGDIAGAL